MCTAKNDVTILEDKVDALVDDVVRTVDPGFSAVEPADDCNAGKKSCIGKLEAKQKPTKTKTLCAVTSNVAALETKVDAFVAGVMSAIRLAPS